jgi:hypothetical protein
MTNNYRGICVSSCLGKQFTSLLQNRLTLFLEEHDLLSPNQVGLRAGYSGSPDLKMEEICDIFHCFGNLAS